VSDAAQLLELLNELRAEVVSLRVELSERGLVERPAPPTPAGAVRGVREAARVLGVGRNTIRRVIAEQPPHRRPAAYGDAGTSWWPSEDACRDWWRGLHQAAAPKPRGPRRRGPDIVDVVDDDAIARALRLR
jgi:hypothetical protein